MGTTETKAKREPTAHERAATRRLIAKRAAKPSTPTLIVTAANGAANIAHSHPDPLIGEVLLLDALGTTDHEFYDGFVCQLAMAAQPGGTVDERTLRFLLAVVKGIEPRDQLETMLAAQMGAIHAATMTAAARLAAAETLPQADNAQATLNKLARTFTTQLETLKRYRSEAIQTVVVQRVTVTDGGQAIVGNVSQGEGVATKSRGQSHEPSRKTATRAALPCHLEANGQPVPSAGRARQSRLPVSGGASGSA